MKEELSKTTHTESDLVGEREVPETALYDVQTLRGIENFRISKYHPCEYPSFISALAITKVGATIANFELGLLAEGQADTILHACREILEGKHHDQFPADIAQGGVGTTTNMDTNEVIANCALELIEHKCGEYQYCSPSDHVNRSQSANDAYPTTIHAGTYYTHLELVKYFKGVIGAFRRKIREFTHVIKMGRIQLEDMVPVTPGQTSNDFASVLQDEIESLDFAAQDFLTVNMGAITIGTGITAEPEYAARCIAALRKITGLDIRLAGDLIGATSDTSCLMGYFSAMRRTVVKMGKIHNGLHLLAPGPRCGLGEVNLPAMRPGSSIIPDKINPVIPEVMNQIGYRVIGNDLCVAMSGETAQMELNAIEPAMAQYCFESADLLINGFDTLHTLYIDDITASEEKHRRDVHNSISVMTALNPAIGYRNSAKIAKEAQKAGKGVYELVLEHSILSKEDLDTVLKPENMIHPVKLDIKPNN